MITARASRFIQMSSNASAKHWHSGAVPRALGWCAAFVGFYVMFGNAAEYIGYWPSVLLTAALMLCMTWLFDVAASKRRKRNAHEPQNNNSVTR